MDMMQPPMAEATPQPGQPGMGEGTTVTIIKKPDGTFAVNGEPCESMEAAMGKAAEILGDDRMSVEQAFGHGFQGDRVDGPGY